MEISFTGDYSKKCLKDEKYDMLVIKNLKFLFYRYNYFLDAKDVTMQRLRHSENVKDEVGLTELPRQNWHHFMEKILVICEDEIFILTKKLIWTKI